MRLTPLFALFALLFGVLHALTEQQPTFEQAVSTYYRSAAILSSHQLQWLQIIQADQKAVDASIETMKQRCEGTLTGLDKFEPTCTPKAPPKAESAPATKQP
jgi:hypothetical protein